MICILADCFTDSDLPSKNSANQNLGTMSGGSGEGEKLDHSWTDGQRQTRNIDLIPGPGGMPFVRRWARASPGKIRGSGPQNVPAALLLYSETLNMVLWSMAQSLWLQNRTRSTYNEHSLQTSFLILASDLAIPLSIGLLVE